MQLIRPVRQNHHGLNGALTLLCKPIVARAPVQDRVSVLHDIVGRRTRRRSLHGSRGRGRLGATARRNAVDRRCGRGCGDRYQLLLEPGQQRLFEVPISRPGRSARAHAAPDPAVRVRIDGVECGERSRGGGGAIGNGGPGYAGSRLAVAADAQRPGNALDLRCGLCRARPAPRCVGAAVRRLACICLHTHAPVYSASRMGRYDGASRPGGCHRGHRYCCECEYVCDTPARARCRGPPRAGRPAGGSAQQRHPCRARTRAQGRSTAAAGRSRRGCRA